MKQPFLEKWSRAAETESVRVSPSPESYSGAYFREKCMENRLPFPPRRFIFDLTTFAATKSEDIFGNFVEERKMPIESYKVVLLLLTHDLLCQTTSIIFHASHKVSCFLNLYWLAWHFIFGKEVEFTFLWARRNEKSAKYRIVSVIQTWSQLLTILLLLNCNHPDHPPYQK